jgi:hypothetical protein
MAAISSRLHRCFHSSVIGVRPAFGSHRFNPPRLPISAKCGFEWLRPPNEQMRRISAAVLASTGIRTTCSGSFRVMAGGVIHPSVDVNPVPPDASGTLPRPVFRREIEVPSRRSARARKRRRSRNHRSASPLGSPLIAPRQKNANKPEECVLTALWNPAPPQRQDTLTLHADRVTSGDCAGAGTLPPDFCERA